MNLKALMESRVLWRARRRYRKARYAYHTRRDSSYELRSKWRELYQQAHTMVDRRDKQIAAARYPTAGQLRHVCPHLTAEQAKRHAAALAPAFARYGITTPRRAAMAVAQLAHESAGLRTTTEYASGAAYEGRRDLGNTQPGDGVRFKGRGYIQITGRSNYAAVSKALGHNFVERPKDLSEPRWAAEASCWWWEAHGLNGLCDRIDNPADRLVAVTRVINGGTNGLPDRRVLFARAQRVIN